MMTVTSSNQRKTTVRDMTEGSIVRQVTLFALPLMLGNIFQMLYNTVDSIVVGNFVGTEALAAVGSTTMIVNMMVFFFNGFSTGAGVVIAHFFGARDMDRLHKSIETTMAATFVLSLLFTVAGVAAVKPMLRFMATPEDVFGEATVYLQIYIGGISGLLVYNMGSGILRAVGDTMRPLYFLILTSVLNIILDLTFVLGLHMGIEGVALATIISQFISAFLTLTLLTRSRDIYRLTWHDLKIDRAILGRIFAVGMPAGIQSIITSFSNVFVQSYVNYFGSSCMAGWSCYNKLDQFIMLPMQSMAMAATTFVSQNIGAGDRRRADKGTVVTVSMSVGVTAVIVAFLCIFAAPAVGLFSPDQAVIEFGVLFIRANCFFLLFNCVNHVLAGALRGMGDSKGPMVIMLLSFVGIRQIYLFVVTRFIANTPFLVGFGYPVGWTTCCVIELSYYFLCCRKRKKEAALGTAR
ncbi:MAG: MATE family efflux transporter [Eubacteriales bacterium]|nr:MATE family efflux transporter [Eubacteriales bacterium]